MEYGKYKQLKASGNVQIVRKDGDMYFERDSFNQDTGEKKQIFEGCPNIDSLKLQLAQFQAASEGLQAIIDDQQAILDAEEKERNKDAK